MLLDSDVVLIGTGLAPLVAARRFLNQEKSVLIVNPLHDFFAEDSEMPFDPLWPWTTEHLSPRRVAHALFDEIRQALEPVYPGSLGFWPETKRGGAGAGDALAPFIRERNRLWLSSVGEEREWEAVEDLFLKLSDLKPSELKSEQRVKPQTLKGLLALNRFPGAAAAKAGDPERLQGILVPKLADVDVSRYRNGTREFIRERLGDARLATSASPIELMNDGVRFRGPGGARTARVRESVAVFWTPRLTSWILQQAARYEVKPILPRGVRLWEEWSLISKDPLDPQMMGAWEDLVAWSVEEGAPKPGASYQLGVLRAGPIVPAHDAYETSRLMEEHAASSESFRKISRLCNEFLKWDRFTIRSMKVRPILEWGEGEASSFILHRGRFETRVFHGADGAIGNVVREAKLAADRLLAEPEEG